MEELLFFTGKEKTKKGLQLPKIIFIIYTLLITFIVFYFIFINKTHGIYYQNLAKNFKTLEFLIPAKRGNILDQHGKLIAQSIPAFDIYINLQKATEEEKDVFANLIQNNRVFYRGEYALLRAVPLKDISEIVNQKDKYPNFEILPSYSRLYFGGEAIGHISGYIGFSQESNSDLFYGLSGLEKFYDSYLRGKPGKIVYRRKPNGDKGEKINEVESVAGYDIVTTIDLEFQEKSYQLMKDYFQKNGFQKGVLLALNPKTGEVIALISFPSYDPNWFFNNSQKINQIFQDPLEPLFNRAISGQYSPGSTIKPLVGLAALEEGIVTPEKEFYAGGSLRIPHPYIPGQFSIFHDWKVHGWTDLRKAIAHSVNVYFYIIGGGYQDQIGLGIQKLLKWWKIFHLGQKTGIDLPGESSGFLPTPENKYKLHPLNPIWRVGDTYNVSIGQGDLLVTPLQIALWTAALATNKLVKPHLIDKIIDQNGNVIFQKNASYFWQNLLNEKNLKVIQEGMRQAVTEGTAKYYLADLPYEIAGKTGTPEILGKRKLNSIFTGYAPYDDPEIVLTILIEETPEGSISVLPLYREVMKTYFELKNKN